MLSLRPVSDHSIPINATIQSPVLPILSKYYCILIHISFPFIWLNQYYQRGCRSSSSSSICRMLSKSRLLPYTNYSPPAISYNQACPSHRSLELMNIHPKGVQYSLWQIMSKHSWKLCNRERWRALEEKENWVWVPWNLFLFSLLFPISPAWKCFTGISLTDSGTACCRIITAQYQLDRVQFRNKILGLACAV